LKNSKTGSLKRLRPPLWGHALLQYFQLLLHEGKIQCIPGIEPNTFGVAVGYANHCFSFRQLQKKVLACALRAILFVYIWFSFKVPSFNFVENIIFYKKEQHLAFRVLDILN
jgi:hypothetical protein